MASMNNRMSAFSGSAVLRTHGGFGNQVFQVLFARLYARKHGVECTEIHDLRYKHRFSRSVELGRFPGRPSLLQQGLSALRIPKLLLRAGCDVDEKVAILGTVYLDGYFQLQDHYAQFDKSDIADQLVQLGRELGIPVVNVGTGMLYHLRLGDFFTSTDAARLHAVARLRELRPGSTIISNQEQLLDEPALKSVIQAQDCQVLSTEGMKAEEVVRLMCTFRQIVANESTLTFWASVLGGCDVNFQSDMLRTTNSYFLGCLESRR